MSYFGFKPAWHGFGHFGPILILFWPRLANIWPWGTKFGNFMEKLCSGLLTEWKSCLVLASRPMNTVLALFGPILTLFLVQFDSVTLQDQSLEILRNIFVQHLWLSWKNVLLWLLTSMTWFWQFWPNSDPFLAQIGQYLTMRNKIWKFYSKFSFRI